MISKGAQYLLMATFFYSLMNVSVKFVFHIPVMEVVFFRSLICVTASFIHLKIIHQSLWGNNKPALILRGLFGVISMSAFFFTLQEAPLASAVTIQYLSPIFTIILATFIVKERTSLIQYLFFVISFIGVAFIKWDDSRISMMHLIAGITSAFFSGLSYNLIRKTANTEHPMVVVFYLPLIALPISIVFTCFNFVMPEGTDWVFLFLAGAFTQLGQTFMTMALQQEKAGSIVNLQYAGMIFSMFLGFMIFRETYPVWSIAGMILIVGGIIGNVFYTRYIKNRRAV